MPVFVCVRVRACLCACAYLCAPEDSKYVETTQPRPDPELLHRFLEEVMKDLIALEDSSWPFLVRKCLCVLM